MLIRKDTSYVINLPEDIQEALSDLIARQTPLKERADKVLKVLLMLWTRPWAPTSNADMIPDPTIRYLALSTLKSDGGFLEPHLITNILARIQYCMRLVFLQQMHYSGDDLHAACDNLCHWFTEKVDSTFNSIRSLQHRASSIAYSHISLPRIWWTDVEHFQTLLYRGHPIHLRDIKKMLSAMERQACATWEEDVLMSLDIRADYDTLHDDLSNNDVGYSFATEYRNEAFHDQTHLISRILKDVQLRSQFVTLTESGAVIWNVHALRKWLTNYAKFSKLQLTRVNLTSGSPSRGTELTAMTIQNTREYQTRNLVIFGRHVTVLCTYQKTSALTGSDKCIPHSLDAFCSDLMIQDIAIARPFARFAASVVYPDQPNIIDLYRRHLFVNHTKLFTTEDLTDSLERWTLPHVGYKLGVNAWRHVSTAFRRKLCARFDNLLAEDENETVGALQSGHSRRTENRVYALSPDALSGASEDILPLFLQASTDWQVVCEVVPGGTGSPYARSLMDQSNLKTPGSSKSDHHQVILASIEEIKNCLKTQQRSLDILIGNDHNSAMVEPAPPIK